MILGKVVPAQGKPDLAEKAEQAFRRARERREEAVRAELREKIATGVEESSWAVRTGEPALVLPEDVADLAARIRAGEFG